MLKRTVRRGLFVRVRGSVPRWHLTYHRMHKLPVLIFHIRWSPQFLNLFKFSSICYFDFAWPCFVYHISAQFQKRWRNFYFWLQTTSIQTSIFMTSNVEHSLPCTHATCPLFYWELKVCCCLPWVHPVCRPDNKPWCDSPTLCRRRARTQPASASWRLPCPPTGPRGSKFQASLLGCDTPQNPSAHSRGWWSSPLPPPPHPTGNTHTHTFVRLLGRQQHAGLTMGGWIQRVLE